MKILVTGSAGMIGSQLVGELLDRGYEVVGVDRRESKEKNANTIVADITDLNVVKSIMKENHVDRIIHLAALAHSVPGQHFTYEDYYNANVVCAENIFKAAGTAPVLFISTIDVYGFTKGVVGPESPIHPVTVYGKTKAMAEKSCEEHCAQYSVFRLSPVYTARIKRDIQKRYYLKYPKIAYRIGRGEGFEVLDIDLAVQKMADWCAEEPDNKIHIIKDQKLLDVNKMIENERKCGRAKCVLVFPKWIVYTGFMILKLLTGENKYTFLLNKAVNPMRTL